MLRSLTDILFTRIKSKTLLPIFIIPPRIFLSFIDHLTSSPIACFLSRNNLINFDLSRVNVPLRQLLKQIFDVFPCVKREFTLQHSSVISNNYNNIELKLFDRI